MNKNELGSLWARMTSCILVVLFLQFTPVERAEAQFQFETPDEEYIDEIVVYGRSTIAGYFTITMYEVPSGWGLHQWAAQLGNAIDDNLSVVEEADANPKAKCSKQQSQFRQSCLNLAGNANNLCLATVGLFAGAGGFISGPGAIGVGVVGAAYCNDLHYQATNSCHDAADNFSWPEAPPNCG